MGNNLLIDNPTIKDIKIFLGKIEENIDNIGISIIDDTLIFSSTTTNIINQ